ncbi:MAG: hypothetical protein JSS76_00595 [Bacteroidetes bacterium]|nr:hypothetical protein [Bacteroidota bacterium]
MKWLKNSWKDIVALLALMFSIEPRLIAFAQFMLKPSIGLQGISPLNLVTDLLLILILIIVIRLFKSPTSQPKPKKKIKRANQKVHQPHL